jgi:Ca2+-binding RTX toxin-like protein
MRRETSRYANLPEEQGNASLYGVGAAARVSERRIILLRKIAMLLLALVLMMVLASGVALAAAFIGTSGNDELTGTEDNDYLEGRAGDDLLNALGGDDIIYGNKGTDRITPGEGADQVFAGAGNDLIYARDITPSRDLIDCGGGFDQVETIHRDDMTLSNCERALGPRKGDIPR